jgi:hypothetical protein
VASTSIADLSGNIGATAKGDDDRLAARRALQW